MHTEQSKKLFYQVEGNILWEYQDPEILSLLNGVKSTELNLTFTSTRTDNGSKLFLLNSENGGLIFNSNSKYK